MKRTTVEKISYLIEEDRVYLNAKLTEKNFSTLLGISRPEMKELLRTNFYMNFHTLIAINRLLYARGLMLTHDIDYHDLWTFSGFRSFREFSRSCSRLGL